LKITQEFSVGEVQRLLAQQVNENLSGVKVSADDIKLQQLDPDKIKRGGDPYPEQVLFVLHGHARTIIR
jgi:hypothetical protein